MTHDPLLPIDPDLEPDDTAEPSPTHVPSARRAPSPRVLGAVAAGGFLGTLARYGAQLQWPAPPGHFPWTIWWVNVSGALALGIVLTVILERFASTQLPRAFLCAGVLGSWTTMSALAGESDLLIRGGAIATAASYLTSTIVLGVAATWTGMAMARRYVVRRVEPAPEAAS